MIYTGTIITIAIITILVMMFADEIDEMFND